MTLAARLDRFGRARSRLLDSLATLPAPVLAERPGPEKWSILEILEHVARAERAVFRDFPDLSTLQPEPRWPRWRFRLLMVSGALRMRLPLRAPSRAMLPTGNLSFDEVAALWDDGFRWLTDALARLSPEQLRQPLFHHPVTGPITFAEAHQLNELHLRTHERQIERLLRDPQ